MKSFLTHIRDEKAAREAKTRENAQQALLAKASEEYAANDPRGDVAKPYKTDMSREMGDFTGDSSSEEKIEPVKPPAKKIKTPENTKSTGKSKSRGSRTEGMSTTEIATHLGVSQPTVSIQTQSAFEKFKQDPVLAKWAEARKARKVPSYTMDPIDATTPMEKVRDYAYMQQYKAHLAAHMKGEGR